MKQLPALLILVCAFMLQSCSSTLSKGSPPVPQSTSGEETSHWRVRGKFTYRSAEMSQSGNFDWRQQGEQYQLRLFGPLGMGTVRISGRDNLVRIQTSEQDISSARPLSLLHRLTGLKIPLNSLDNWLLGKPASASAENLVLDSHQRVTGFDERAWTLSYSNFKAFGQSTDETARIELATRITALQDDVRLHMQIRNWRPE